MPKKSNFCERIWQQAWTQYEYKARAIGNVEKKIELLLAISGIMATILFSLITSSNGYSNPFVLVSVIGLSAVFIATLYDYIIPHKKRFIPFIEEVDTRKFHEKSDVEGFFKDFVYSCHKMNGEANNYVKDRIRLLRNTTFLLIVSLYLPIAYHIYVNYLVLFSGSLVAFAVIIIAFYKAFQRAMKDL